MFSEEPLNLRGELAGWLRLRRHRLVRPGPATESLLACWGLDDRTLGRFAAAPRVVATLPHASPNVFFPRAHVSWYTRHRQRHDPDLFHWRIVLTHTNFSDLGWRPYAWWYLDADVRLRRHSLFTRNKKRKHTVIASQGTLLEVPADLTGVDAAAGRYAGQATDLAGSLMAIGATVERAAGLADDSTMYLPLNLLLKFVLETARGDGVAARWCAALTSQATFRRMDDMGELMPTVDPTEAFVFDNSANLAVLGAFGTDAVVGGAKMARYWPGVEAVRLAADDRSGARSRPPQVWMLPDLVSPTPSPGVASQLGRAGIPYSQGLALRDHGRFGDRDPFRYGGSAAAQEYR